MNSRERNMMVLLGALGIGGIAFVGYNMVWLPVQEYQARAVVLAGELADKETKLDNFNKQQKRVKEIMNRSLPGDKDDADREYPAALDRLLRAAGINGATITPKDSGDTRNIPKIDNKTPAYNRVGFEIRMKKVNIPTITKFLESYYNLSLLHQITTLDIKRSDESMAASRRTQEIDAEHRNDLEVTLVTEAIIVDGASKRDTLFPVPAAQAAISGGLGQQLMSFSPLVARGLKPLKYSPVLSTLDRDYAAMSTKDLFHGPLPEPKKIVVAETEKPQEVVPEKPKPDTSAYVKLTDITRRNDGTIESHIYDVAHDMDYQIDLKPSAERPDVRVQKFFFVDGKPKRTEISGEEREINYLAINEAETSVDRSFKVMGVALYRMPRVKVNGKEVDDIEIPEIGLVLTESVKVMPEEKKGPGAFGGPPAGFGGPGAPAAGPGGRGARTTPTRLIVKGPDAAKQAILSGFAAVPVPPKPIIEE